MFINPAKYTNNMQSRRILGRGQQVASNGMGGFFDDVVSVVTAPIKAIVVTPIASVVGAVTGGIPGAIGGAKGGLMYSAGPVLAPIMQPLIGMRKLTGPGSTVDPLFTVDPNPIEYTSGPAKPVPMWQLPAPVPAITSAPLTPNATIGMQSAATQASYGQMPYAPRPEPGYDADGRSLPPLKKEIPWAAIATGSMAAVTLIAAVMNKHSSSGA